MKLTIDRVLESGEVEEIASTSNESEARKIASREARRRPGQVYISWFRSADGQRGYLNTDGHSPVGKPW